VTNDTHIELSVVIGLVSGAATHLRTCLTSLEAQRIQGMEIIVPYDPPCADVAQLAADFPQVEFVYASELDTEAARAGHSREHHGTLRTIGMRRARGRIIALIEDVGRADAGWCQGLIDGFDRHQEAGAIGGQMACGSRRLLNRAVCMSDFWRYQPTLDESRSTFASDANIAYLREALQSIPGALEGSLHETVVNEALMKSGRGIWLTPEVTVYQERGDLTLSAVLRERFVWGRSFGGMRVKDLSLKKRMPYAIGTPLLPLLLAWRTMKLAKQRGNLRSQFLPSLPILLPLFTVWALGEMVGYLTAKTD
jgi:hypothetical protein